MYLYDMNGVNCGAAGENPAPAGYWLRDQESQDAMPSIYFLERLGKDIFFTLWQAALANPDLLFQMFRGFAAQNILITESFPALYQFEQMGLIPAGTAIRVWS